MSTARRIVGPRMAEVLSYVQRHPGCPKLHPARVVAPNGSLMYGYRTVNRAIAAGLVRSEWVGARYALYPAED